MKCPSCFADLPEGIRFCDHCGTPIPQAEVPAVPVDQAVPAQPAVPVEPAVPVQPMAPPVMPVYAAPVTPSYAPPPMPQAPAPAASVGKPKEEIFAIVSLVAGILSVCSPCCGLPLSIAGLVFGFLGLKSSQKTLAIIGMIASGLGILVSLLFTVLGGLSMVGSAMSDPGMYMGY